MLQEEAKAPEVKPETREMTLKRDLVRFQLQYIDRLIKGEIPPPSLDVDLESMTFGEVLENFTSLTRRVKEAYTRIIGEDPNTEHPVYKALLQKIWSGIENEYEQGGDWSEHIYEYINSAIADLSEEER